MSDAILLVVITTIGSVATPVAAISAKRWWERRPKRTDLYDEISKLWCRIGELDEELVECRRSHRACETRVDALLRTVEDMQCRGPAGCRLAGQGKA